jgi:hypothetical protein
MEGSQEHPGFTNLLPVIQRLVPSHQVILKLPLKAMTETTFTGHGNPNDEITFVRSPNGEIRECILISDGLAVRAIRVK